MILIEDNPLGGILMKTRKLLLNTVVAFFFLCVNTSSFAACIGDQTAQQQYKVYIIPQLTATETYTRWAPLLERLGKETQQCFELTVPVSIPQFESDLLQGKPDFAFMNPYHLVMDWRENRYIPLVASAEPIFGILTVKNDGKINNIQELKGSRIAFPSPNSFGASLLIRATLSKEGIAFEPDYVRTHSNVYRAVIRGSVQAGGGIQSTFAAEPEALKEGLKTLMETKRYTSHPFSANDRVPELTRTSIQKTLLAMNQSSTGSELLKRVHLGQAMSVTYSKNYQPLEALDLERFVIKSAE